MNISNLTLTEISHKMRKYLPPHLQKYNENESLFQESISLQFDEISPNIPKRFYKYFNDNDFIQNACGIISSSKYEYDYTIILLSDEKYTTALLLLLQKENKRTGEFETELLKSFLSENTDGLLLLPQLKRYYNTVTEIQKIIESDMDNLTKEKINNQFKKALDDILWQTKFILGDTVL